MIFSNWTISVDTGFWNILSKKKLEQYKLTSEIRPLISKFSIDKHINKRSYLNIDAFSFQEWNEEKMGSIEYKVHGRFLNTNTIQEFKEIDIVAQQDKLLIEAKNIVRSLINEDNQENSFPNFTLFIFADLKKHEFSYFFLATSIAVKDYENIIVEPARLVFKDNMKTLNKSVKAMHLGEKIRKFCVFKWILQEQKKQLSISSLKQFIEEPKQEYIFFYVDATNEPTMTSFTTSNILALFATLLQQKRVPPERLARISILLIKDPIMFNPTRQYLFQHSQIWTLNLSNIKINQDQPKLLQPNKTMELDLKKSMDQKCIAKQAVDLNIKLMKWRLLPRLNIEKIMNKKCLLFGAGTLGCQIARNLIGWGIKNISFIDYSKVSYSNPVRQTLYQYEDTIKGGRPKAIVAAEKLKKIYPQIQSKGYHISVPMPGHFIRSKSEEQQMFKNLDIIEKLVSQHDVLFLLLDSRQARWLPTVLANKFDKACITVGLGFDSFVIVRHGVSPKLFKPEIHKQRISCYFCNDIVTPQNTMKDRTLDQMCTVTRPGLSFTSSAYASQLYISLIHHQLEHHVWADEDSNKLQTTDLGKLPHHIRGCMSDFEVNIMYGRAFQQCVACSLPVLEQYNTNREQFMVNVMNNPNYIHDKTGLSKQIAQWENMDGNNFIEIIDDDQQQQEE